MQTCPALLAAQQRKTLLGCIYAGAATPAEAWTILKEYPHARLIDVRTNAERDWVGRVNIASTQHGAVQWNLYPQGMQNPEFLMQLAQQAQPDTLLLFLCRSGVRSRHAATLAATNGYTQCFDILEGFEGDKDMNGHRKNVNGWCKAELPWIGA